MSRKIWTETWLKSLVKKPPLRRQDHTERGRRGLMLRHHPGGALTFCVRYHRGTEQVLVTIGNYPEVSLERAHDRHAEIRRQLAQGLDPAEELEHEKRALAAARARRREDDAVTIRNVIAEFAWYHCRRHRKHPREAVRLLRANLEAWQGRAVAELVKRDAVLLLDKITARGSLVMANRVRDLAHQAFQFAIERDLIENNPFAGIRKPGGDEKPKERTLTADELRSFWGSLASPHVKISQSVRLVLKLILVTAQRPGEVMGATWSELELEGDAPLWRIPAARSKSGRPHEVPLSDFALELLGELRALQADQPRLCIAPSHQSKLKPDESLSERALSRALRNNHGEDGKLFGLTPFTPHDLRRSAATHMSSLGIPRLHVAKVLGHADRDITSVYDRHSYLPEKRLALQTWSDHLRAIIAGKASKVTPLHAGGAAKRAP